MTDKDLTPEAVERAIGMCRAHGLHGTEAALRALSARVFDLEAAIDSAEAEHGLTSNGNLWRFWSKEARDLASKLTEERARAEAAEAERDALKAQLAEAVGVLRQIRNMKPHHAGQTPNEYHMQDRARAYLARHQKEAGV